MPGEQRASQETRTLEPGYVDESKVRSSNHLATTIYTYIYIYIFINFSYCIFFSFICQPIYLHISTRIDPSIRYLLSFSLFLLSSCFSIICLTGGSTFSIFSQVYKEHCFCRLPLPPPKSVHLRTGKQYKEKHTESCKRHLMTVHQLRIEYVQYMIHFRPVYYYCARSYEH